MAGFLEEVMTKLRLEKGRRCKPEQENTKECSRHVGMLIGEKTHPQLHVIIVK